jgi:Leucine-rich repeat (LRR) protein
MIQRVTISQIVSMEENKNNHRLPVRSQETIFSDYISIGRILQFVQVSRNYDLLEYQDLRKNRITSYPPVVELVSIGKIGIIKGNNNVYICLTILSASRFHGNSKLGIYIIPFIKNDKDGLVPSYICI